jgi:hypothetical protein
MDWSKLGEKVANMAPVLGSALGPGGTAVGSLIATAFGTENDPDEIGKAIQGDPEAAAKLKRIEAEHAEEMRRLAMKAAEHRMASETARISEVNKTMRAGYDAGVYWRRAWGWISAISFGVLVITIGVLSYLGIAESNTEAMRMIPQLVSAATTLFGIPAAILGIDAWHSGKERRAMAGDTGGAVEKAVKAFRK